MVVIKEQPHVARLKGLFTASDSQLIIESVQKAERTTSAEIVPVITAASSEGAHGVLVAFLVFAFIVFFPPVFGGLTQILGGNQLWAAALATLVPFAMAFAAWRFDRVRQLFVSSQDSGLAVHQKALLQFERLNLRQTESRTGILLFVSLREHRAVVMADEAISSRLPSDTWGEVIQLILAGAKSGKLAAGIADATVRCGEICAPLFPPRAGDRDELKNHLRFVE